MGAFFQMGETMKNIIIVLTLLGAVLITAVLYCAIVVGSQSEKRLTEMMHEEEFQNEDKEE